MSGMRSCFLIISLLVQNALTATPECQQSTTLNEDDCELALDSNDQTCAQTGFSYGSWWKMMFQEARLVKGVKVKGKFGSFEVRVGNNTDDIARRSGFIKNPRCVMMDDSSLRVSTQIWSTVLCDYPIYGRVISLKAVDPTRVEPLLLCSIQLLH